MDADEKQKAFKAWVEKHDFFEIPRMPRSDGIQVTRYLTPSGRIVATTGSEDESYFGVEVE